MDGYLRSSVAKMYSVEKAMIIIFTTDKAAKLCSHLFGVLISTRFNRAFPCGYDATRDEGRSSMGRHLFLAAFFFLPQKFFFLFLITREAIDLKAQSWTSKRLKSPLSPTKKPERKLTIASVS
jgi:hypothetical protein